jgi:uncharacterized membrane protein
MREWLDFPVVQALLAVVFVMALVLVGLRVVVALRPSTGKADTSDDYLAQNFEEMQLEGDISDEELRTIKAVIGKTRDKRPGD